MEVSLVVDFIKRHPVLHFVLIASENHSGKTDKEIDQLTIAPATIFRHQVIRHLEMRQCNHRFNPILQAFIKEIVVELQSGFIGLCFIALRENTRPCNRGTKTLKSHFSKQLNIILITMIKIDGLVVRVIFTCNHAVGNFTRYPMGPSRHHIGNANPFTALLPAAFQLMSGHSAAPHKICFKPRHTFPLS